MRSLVCRELLRLNISCISVLMCESDCNIFMVIQLFKTLASFCIRFWYCWWDSESKIALKFTILSKLFFFKKSFSKLFWKRFWYFLEYTPMWFWYFSRTTHVTILSCVLLPYKCICRGGWGSGLPQQIIFKII